MPGLPITPPTNGATGWGSDINTALAAAFGLMGSLTKTVAGNDEPAHVKAACDYVCDGTADQVQINAAIDAVATLAVTSNAKGSNGGTVILVGRQFYLSGAILQQSQTTLRGAYGKDGTWLRPQGYAPGASGGLLQLAHLDSQYTTVRDLGLRIDGADVCGIRHHMGTGQEYDGYHTATEIHMWHPGNIGLNVVNNSGGRMRGNHYSFMRILDPDSYGVSINAPDSFYSNIDVGSAGNHAFYINHANNRLVNCKGWFADQDGFHLTSTGRDNQLTACESQDNQRHGYYVGAARTLISSSTADSNSHPSGGVAGSGDGFNVVANGFNIHGAASDKNESSRGRQQRYGVNIVGSIRGIVNVTTFGNATAPSNGTGHASTIVNVVDTPV